MTNQVLYGETFSILEVRKKLRFTLIRLDHDSYEGWIDSKTFFPLSGDERVRLSSGTTEVTHDLFTVIKSPGSRNQLVIGCGSTIRFSDNKVLDLYEDDYYLPRSFRIPVFTYPRQALARYGYKLLSVPYLWGGRSGFGFDCSGLCQNLYSQIGMIIPRDSDLQAGKGRVVSFIDDARTGDLAFFDNDNGEIVHVGMIIGRNSILHCSGKVRIDRIDHQGIFSLEKNSYTHRLRVIKDVISEGGNLKI